MSSDPTPPSVDPASQPFTRKSPYQFFVDALTPTIKAQNPDASDQEIQRLLAVYHATQTTPADRAGWIAQAEAQEAIDRAARASASATYRAAQSASRAAKSS